jgi:hypothetical protein
MIISIIYVKLNLSLVSLNRRKMARKTMNTQYILHVNVTCYNVE